MYVYIHISLSCWVPFHPPCHSSRLPQSTKLTSLWSPRALFSTHGSSTSWKLDGWGGLLSSCWKSGPQTSSFKWEALLQVKELGEKILKPLWNTSPSSPRQAVRKAALQVPCLFGTQASEDLSFWCRIPSFKPCCVRTYDPVLNSGPCVTVRAMENKVATQLFWMVSQCSWFLATEKCFQGQD